jgi:glycosyltransferase involved in cell wall biosynthesis
MKILYIITQADGGGAQKYVLALAKHFRGIIAAGQEAKMLFDQASKDSIVTYRLKHLKRNISLYSDLMAIFEIRSLIKTYNPDIVHLNSSKAGFLGSLACVFLKTKVVFTAHGFIFNEPMPVWKKNFYIVLEKIAGFFRDFIITVSDADKNSALKYNLISKNKIKTIYNGIAPINFYSAEKAKKRLGLPEDKKIFFAIANDYPTKGLDVLEKAVNLNPIANTLTVVIGEAKNKNSSGYIKYLGYVENAASYFKAANGTILPSRKEGLPYALLEAMQAGQPIIASNVGGIPEAVADAGELIPPDDPSTLRKYIELDFMNEKKSAELSKKALERSKIFTEAKMLNETKKIYDQILNTP